MPTVSVVIPCYNQGKFLDDAVSSALAQTWDDLEIIIVNDGSDDAGTAEACNSYADPRIRVVNTDNQGLAAARNNGIGRAGGTYILPLDADDRIAPEYIAEAVAVLEANEKIGIVYCQARLFDAVDQDWQLPPYSLEEMLKDNIIFCTALFRKRDWAASGGYDTGMIYGWEDYEFWLSLIERGLGVHRLEGRYFYYRVSPESMVRSVEKSKKIEMFKRIFQRHQNLYSDHIEVWLEPLLELREPYLTGRLYIDNGQGISNEDSVVRKLEPSRRTIRFPIDRFAGPRALRFDPAECPVCVDIEKIELGSPGADTALNLHALKSNADIREGNHFMFSTDDPQIYLTTEEALLAHCREVAITCTVTATGGDALREIIKRLKKKSDLSPRPGLVSRWLRSGV